MPDCTEDDDCDVGSDVGSSNQVAAARLEVAPDIQLSFFQDADEEDEKRKLLQVTCRIEVVLTTISIILESKLNVFGTKLLKFRKISDTLAAR